MFIFNPIIAQIPDVAPPTPQEIIQPQTVRPLPGSLDNIPVFNSNSPELVLNEGILLSTFPGDGKQYPQAHLNFAFTGRFDIFAHHVARAPSPDNLRSLYIAIVVYNPNNKPVTIDILQASTYLSQPDAPFIDLPPQVQDYEGRVYAGPGSRVAGDILRGYRDPQFPPSITLAGGETGLLMNLPIPVKDLTPPLNGRSTYLRLNSSDKVYVASLSLYAPVDETGNERAPNINEWQSVLTNANLVTPRDKVPTLPEQIGGIVYGRVAGVTKGSQWQAQLTDDLSSTLTISDKGQSFSYGISTLEGGKLGTDQSQSAPILARYHDTAYKSHGNYGVQYNLTLPLYNPTSNLQTVTISLQTPIKQEKLDGGLRFLNGVVSPVFYRGPVRVSYKDNYGQQQSKYFHIVQRRGEKGSPLLILSLEPQQTKEVQIDLIYPPDATPPQVLTITTEN
ncbi:MAG: hypothetical protein N5P05_000042 [Chroococcopsis gigantea SAG 12.99]|jgi:hypothetical protein|nr:DUF3370 domain-containing protein [Chlorogloea purpurea SAG 13.99]MDV2998436.1 hypothetical protein [Chroococcopsis gigantea SAG 12.99]